MKDLWGERHQQMEIEEALKEMTIAGSKNLSIWEVMKQRSLRWPLLISILLVTSLQLCGLGAIYFYAFEVFRTARLEELVIPYVTLGIGLCEFASVLLCVSTDELLTHFAPSVAKKKGHAIRWQQLDQGPGGLASSPPDGCLSRAGAIFSVMVEIFRPDARPSALALAGTFSWAGVFIIGISFPFVVEALGHYCFLIFFGVLIGMGLFTYFFIPETKGKSILDITEDLNRIPLGKRRTFPALESSSPLRSHGLCTKL
ncbi:hypothetical protein Chor_000077 [Crotalus horridus]